MNNDYTSLPDLVIPGDETRRKIQSQIEKGQEIRDPNIRIEEDINLSALLRC